jgi:hypothetical protein
MTVDLTPEDLANGEPESCTECPVALAVRRATKGQSVTVEPYGIVVDGILYDVPAEVDAAIDLIDDGRAVDVVPFSFELFAVNA